MANRGHLFISFLLVGLSLFIANVLTAAPRESGPHSTYVESPIATVSQSVRRERAEQIRDTASKAGMTNGVLLAGIGQVETGFAHCWSEATWACKGPPSSSCNGGPVIAGKYDGPCSEKKGGLGIFQFDAGSHSDTIDRYGNSIVTIEGSTESVIPFLLKRAIQSVEGVNSETQAIQWMNSIPIIPGDPLFEEWLYFITWRYLGCKDCPKQQADRRDATISIYQEFGDSFWHEKNTVRCDIVPAEGIIIEENEPCSEQVGVASSWNTETSGHESSLRWTQTSASAQAEAYGIWNLRFEQPGNYEVFVYSDGGRYGQSQHAAYMITYEDNSKVVSIDQSSKEGWISLGNFDFSTEVGQRVRLDHNTGEPSSSKTRLLYDALKIVPSMTPPSTEKPRIEENENENKTTPETGDFVGSCSTGLGKSDHSAWLLPLCLLFAFRKKKNSIEL